jgi:hypothetical protein
MRLSWSDGNSRQRELIAKIHPPNFATIARSAKATKIADRSR